jgi:hypothetical protein
MQAILVSRIAGGAYDQVEQPNSCLSAGRDLWRRELREI